MFDFGAQRVSIKEPLRHVMLLAKSFCSRLGSWCEVVLLRFDSMICDKTQRSLRRSDLSDLTLTPHSDESAMTTSRIKRLVWPSRRPRHERHSHCDCYLSFASDILLNKLLNNTDDLPKAGHLRK